LNEEESERTILALRDLLKNAQPLPHAGLPEDIANVAFWLASEESCFMTGQAIVVDGGLSLGQGWKQTRERRDNIRSYLQRALTVD
jgi:NAD(P)-dependent dehydrogenase (short-subunit alcohol dehydrogenase family)